MPYRKRGITMFRDWEPDEQFSATTDRLLVTTSRRDTFVAMAGPPDDEGSTFVVDKQFMAKNLTSLPHQLKKERSLPLEWDASAFPWEMFLFDGEMTSYGPYLLTEAIGVGWQRSISANFTITHIEPVQVSDINRAHLSRVIQGLQFGEFNVNELAMYDEALRA